MTSICDERGQELLYAGMPISDVRQVIFLLYFRTNTRHGVFKQSGELAKTLNLRVL